MFNLIEREHVALDSLQIEIETNVQWEISSLKDLKLRTHVIIVSCLDG